MEQKNGSIVRRLVGYGRLSGMAATQALAQLYASSRLYINFFQPSFKLKSKTRDGARVHKIYHAPMTPCDQLLAIATLSEEIKDKLREEFARMDPVKLLLEIRTAQKVLADFATDQPQATAPAPRVPSKSFVTHCFLMCPEAFIMLYPDEYVKETSVSYRPGRENMDLCIIINMLETILP